VQGLVFVIAVSNRNSMLHRLDYIECERLTWADRSDALPACWTTRASPSSVEISQDVVTRER